MESTVRRCQLPTPTYVLCRLSEISLSVPHHNIKTNVDIQCGIKSDTCDAQAAQYNVCSHSTHLSVRFALWGNKAQMRHACTLCCIGQRVSLISRVRGNCYGVAITASLRSASSMFDHSVLWYYGQMSCGHAHGQIAMHASTPYDPEQRSLWRQWSFRYSYQRTSSWILTKYIVCDS